MTTTTIAEEDMGRYLTAFADGELDADRSLEVLEYLANHPQATRRVAGQLRLRRAAERSVKAYTPPVPDSLLLRIEALAPSGSPAPAASSTRHSATPAGTAAAEADRRWVPASRDTCWAVATAACLIAGVWIGRGAPGLRGSPPQGVPAPLVSAATRTHVDCSRYTDHFHAPEFPREVSDLPELLRRRLGRAAPYPDLSSIGYEFAGAGSCSVPGASTVHLLYRPRGAEVADTVSVFLQPDAGQVRVEPDKAYLVSAPDAAHPVFVWRTSGAVYYLVADHHGTAEQAIKVIATASNVRSPQPEHG